MEKEVVEFFEAAKKAADAAGSEAGGEAEESRCIDALTQLKNLPITYEVLVSTQVGKSLRILTKHPSKKIQAFAIDLVKIWKNKVVEHTNTVNAKPVKIQKTTPVVSPKQTSMPKCNDAFRDNVREQLYEGLCKVASEVGENMKDEVDACDPIRVAVSVETLLFQKWGKFNGARKAKYRSVLFNIKDPKNPDFRRKVLLGDVKPEKVVDLSSQEMASETRRVENELIKKKALIECERGIKQAATNDQVRCGRCGKRETTYYQMQTRSADEPMTTYITCVNCNKRWKC